MSGVIWIILNVDQLGRHTITYYYILFTFMIPSKLYNFALSMRFATEYAYD